MFLNARIDQLVAEFSNVRRQKVPVARKDSLVALVDDQVKVIDLDGIAVPVFPEEPNGFEGELAGLEFPHERAAKDLFIPPRIHPRFNLIGEFRGFGRGEFFPRLKCQRVLIEVFHDSVGARTFSRQDAKAQSKIDDFFRPSKGQR